MQEQQSAGMHMPPKMRHENDRVVLELPGRLSMPAKGITIDCMVIDLCSSGAGLRCGNRPLLHTYAMLHVDGFGHFECVTARAVRARLDVRFVGLEARRRRLLADIRNYVDEGIGLRCREGTRSLSEIRLTRPNGDQFRCGIDRRSSQGLLLMTTVRPPIGEIVHIGQVFARVAQHHEYGISIDFPKPVVSGDEPQFSVR